MTVVKVAAMGSELRHVPTSFRAPVQVRSQS
ncbi:hypothetical protein KPP03845_106131 [Streptomyces xanthophaeus]|nr:hypothetical protein KPP03845_106131 [Streptomyces xanthophaeus]